MEIVLENIKKVLDSNAGIIIENSLDNSQQEENSLSGNKKVVDNRLKLIKQNIDLVENKDDSFYTDLIRLISYYINELYNRKIENSNGLILVGNELIPQEYDIFDIIC